MSKLKTYSEFINEGLIDAVKNPIKWKKIKNNAKKLQKAKVAQALNNVDYAKRKAKGATSLSPEKKEILKQANLAKNSALSDTTSNIGGRMDDLATTAGLKQVVKLAKTKSALAANQIVLKAATGEEAKQLKIKQKELTTKAAEAQQALADYESTDKPDDNKAKGAQIKALRDKRTPIIQAKSETDDKQSVAKLSVQIKEINVKIAELEDDDIAGAKEDLKAAKDRLAKITGTDTDEDKIAQLEGKIASQDKIQADASKTIEKLKGDLKIAQNNKNTGKSSQADADAIASKIQQATEDRDRAVTEEKALRKKLKLLADKIPESYVPLVESISDKFKRLRPNLS